MQAELFDDKVPYGIGPFAQYMAGRNPEVAKKLADGLRLFRGRWVPESETMVPVGEDWASVARRFE
jgi:hypothetical protein